jgi:hypothetical protein
MDSSAYHLIKRDIQESSGLEIATYRVAKCGLEGGQRYVICKNNKRIGWAMEETGAMQIHDMYARIHVFREDNYNPKVDELIKEMRSKPQDNSLPHDFPEK